MASPHRGRPARRRSSSRRSSAFRRAQIALSVIPALVLLGWAMDRPLGMQLEVYEATTLFASVVLIGTITAQGSTNWLQGLVLVIAYVLIALGFLVHK